MINPPDISIVRSFPDIGDITSFKFSPLEIIIFVVFVIGFFVITGMKKK